MDKRRFSFGGLCVAALFAVLLVHCAIHAAENDAEKIDADEPTQFTAGEETRIEDPTIGGLGYYLIGVPEDYTPDRAWPVIFCYHGMDGKPTTWPFLQLTDGKGYIIVGMEYYKRGRHGREHDNLEVKNLKRVIPLVVKHFNVDKERLYVGGFSKGGWITSVLFEKTTDIWAGMIILGAGRTSRALIPQKLRGRPIFIGLGEHERQLRLDRSKEATVYYRKCGAKVTFELFKGMEHEVDTKNEALRNWLLYNGPLKNAQSKLASAGRLVKNNEPGRAYAIYAGLADVSDTDKTCIAAAKAAEALAKKAEQQLAEAEKAIAEKHYTQAANDLARLAAAYAGCDFGDKAEQKLQMLQTDPQIKEIIKLAEINAKADALEAKAVAAEKEKKYAKAIKLYEQYVSAFPKARRYKQVKSHLAAMKSDKAIQDTICSKDADRDCRKWLMMADNYINAGMVDKARPYLEKILDKYGQTNWAAKARQRLAKISAGNK